jgi:hypothetical protein
MRILVWLVVIAAAAGLAARLLRKKSPHLGDPCERRRDVDIKVSARDIPPTQVPDTVDNLCRNATIHYLITNNSDERLTVKLTKFRKVGTGDPRDPLEFEGGQSSKDVPPGHRRTIVGKVRIDPDGSEQTTRIKYDIEIEGGAVADPELQIRRPTRARVDY